MNLDPAIFSLVQSSFIEHINTAFALVTQYAMNLFYLFATLELVIFGLVWALRQDVVWGQICWQILKIGIIFFLIVNYSWLFGLIGKSFVQLAGSVANTKDATTLASNPAQIWRYGYDVGINLLHQAVLGSSLGLVLLELMLGCGILLVFGLLGIQIILQIVGFYLVALAALIFLPLGVFTATANMLEKAVQNVLKSGVKMMTLLVVIGIATIVFNTFPTFTIAAESHAYSINQILGLFFAALLFLILAMRLPSIVAGSVGLWRVGDDFRQGTSAVSASISPNVGSISTLGNVSPSSVQQATSFDARSVDSSASPSASSSGSVQAVSIATIGAAQPSFQNSKLGASLLYSPKLDEPRGISLATFKKIEKNLRELLQKQNEIQKELRAERDA
ncbi:MAG: type IV secretion system protein [Gammaproteobacteria bacterium]